MSDDVVVAAACTIITAASVKKLRRKSRTCWVRDWMSRRPQYGTHAALLKDIRVSDPKTYKDNIHKTMNINQFSIWLCISLVVCSSQQWTYQWSSVTVADSGSRVWQQWTYQWSSVTVEDSGSRVWRQQWTYQWSSFTVADSGSSVWRQKWTSWSSVYP